MQIREDAWDSDSGKQIYSVYVFKCMLMNETLSAASNTNVGVRSVIGQAQDVVK